jgi:hypothetical protein
MEFKCNKIILNKKSFHYNVYDEIMETYDDYDFEKNFYEIFFEENFELIKKNNKLFEKYNSDFGAYKFLVIRLCILKKNIFGIEKDTCVFIYHDYDDLIIFYLKNNNYNLELAKEVWINEFNYENYKETCYNFDIIEKNKEKYILKKFKINQETEIVVQKSLNIIEK